MRAEPSKSCSAEHGCARTCRCRRTRCRGSFLGRPMLQGSPRSSCCCTAAGSAAGGSRRPTLGAASPSAHCPWPTGTCTAGSGCEGRLCGPPWASCHCAAVCVHMSGVRSPSVHSSTGMAACIPVLLGRAACRGCQGLSHMRPAGGCRWAGRRHTPAGDAASAAAWAAQPAGSIQTAMQAGQEQLILRLRQPASLATTQRASAVPVKELRAHESWGKPRDHAGGSVPASRLASSARMLSCGRLLPAAPQPLGRSPCSLRSRGRLACRPDLGHRNR